MTSLTLFSKHAVQRGFTLWLLSNLGGTLLSGAVFSLDRAEDFTIGLLSGLLAAVVSLPIVPLCIPYLAVVGRLCSCWSRRTAALVGVVLFYSAVNLLFLHFLPIITLDSLLSMSLPYLVAALGAVLYLCEPAAEVTVYAKA